MMCSGREDSRWRIGVQEELDIEAKLFGWYCNYIHFSVRDIKTIPATARGGP
jgi:hypothetical protein